jgi:urease accessory protein
LCAAEDRTTRLAELFQEGCLKIRLPRPATDGYIDAVIINTAGGLTGGDTLRIDVALDQGARATVTTPGCEHIYRSALGDAVIHQRLRVGSGARLDWLPQETILFDRGRLRRRFDVQLEADAEITLLEAVLFGRAAMGETVRTGFLSDFWTIRRDGRLLFADAVRLADPFDRSMACPATLGGRLAMASLIHVGPHLEAKRDALRAGFPGSEGATAGASVVGDVLVTRMVASSGYALRRLLVAALGCLGEGRPLPRNWFC